ncbi:MAG: hypothetical protein HOF27_00345 [Rhodospirillaceae bacterium]|nr:hypothetical protein [Rhodospirillaceae bacterium]
MPSILVECRPSRINDIVNITTFGIPPLQLAPFARPAFRIAPLIGALFQAVPVDGFTGTPALLGAAVVVAAAILVTPIALVRAVTSIVFRRNFRSILWPVCHPFPHLPSVAIVRNPCIRYPKPGQSVKAMRLQRSIS